MTQEVPATNSEARRLYKIGLAKFLAKFVKEKENQKDICGTQDCLRCILIRQGMFFMSDCVVSTCIVQIPEAPMDAYEELVSPSSASAVTEAFAMEDHKNLAISVALGSVLKTKASLTNADPAIRIAQRVVDQTPLMEISSHKCLTIKKPESKDELVKWIMPMQTGFFVNHAVIYAPPGFGKTHLQRELSRSGKFILDTDDVPSVEVKHVAEALHWTSVLTNRLDLLDPSFPTIVFRPVTAKVLHERTSLRNRITTEDAEYWHSLHEFPKHKRIIICHVKDSFVANWFDVDNKVVSEEWHDEVICRAKKLFKKAEELMKQ